MAKETALPLAFLARMAALLDEEFPPFLVALNQDPVSGLRVNTLRLSAEQYVALSPWPLTSVPWCPEGFVLERKANAGFHVYHDAGLYYLQDPSAMAVGTLVAAQPGERILDLCAAPGGKATHLAASLAGRGVLVANEIERSRADVLRHNLERMGARNVILVNEMPERLAARWPDAFDRVLVDAPCSGEGMFRKKDEARFHWSDGHIIGCSLRQRQLIHSAAQMVRPGGRLIYATCTFAPEENEGVVARFLDGHPDFTLERPAWYPGFAPGHPEWSGWPASELSHRPEGQRTGDQHPSSFPESAQLVAALSNTVRLWPHRIQGEGHFIAVLRRAGDSPPSSWAEAEPTRLTHADRQALEAFWQPLIALPVPERLRLYHRGPYTADVFALSPGAPETTGLAAPRPGWHLGTLRKGRFDPSHALGMSLTGSEVCHRLDEPLGSERVARYLRGETVTASGPEGWLLVAVAGFPLGWGKRSGDVIKNHYPHVLRWSS